MAYGFLSNCENVAISLGYSAISQTTLMANISALVPPVLQKWFHATLFPNQGKALFDFIHDVQTEVC